MSFFFISDDFWSFLVILPDTQTLIFSDWNRMKSHEISWNHVKSLKSHEIIWNHWNHTKSHEITEIIRNHLKSVKSHEITEITKSEISLFPLDIDRKEVAQMYSSSSGYQRILHGGYSKYNAESIDVSSTMPFIRLTVK